MAAEGGWFRLGFWPGAGAAPARVGAARSVRPSWSWAGLLVGGSGGWVLAGEGEGGGAEAAEALPGDCRDLLASETHVVLRRRDALEAWPLRPDAPRLALRGPPAWRRPLPHDHHQGVEEETELPLVPGGYVEARPDFFRPLSPALRARHLALGHEHALLLAHGGALHAWGAGRHGQLGRGDLESAPEPRPVEALQGVPLGQVAAGGWHSAGLSEAGDLYVWGWNESGQLGLPSKGAPENSEAGDVEAQGSTASSGGGAPAQHGSHPATFVSIQAFPALLDMPDGADVGKVSCGSRHTAALTRAGALYTWGWGKYGQLGHGDTAASDTPKKVCSFEAWGLGVVDVVCGPWTTYVLTHPP